MIQQNISVMQNMLYAIKENFLNFFLKISYFNFFLKITFLNFLGLSETKLVLLMATLAKLQIDHKIE